jgi:hypothetical protein
MGYSIELYMGKKLINAMNETKLIPHYIQTRLESKYLYYKDSLKLEATKTIEATKEWAISEYRYIWDVGTLSNEWLEELDIIIKEIATKEG